MRRCRFVGTFCVAPSPGRPSARLPSLSSCWHHLVREHPPGNIFDAGVPQVYSHICGRVRVWLRDAQEAAACAGRRVAFAVRFVLAGRVPADARGRRERAGAGLQLALQCAPVRCAALLCGGAGQLCARGVILAARRVMLGCEIMASALVVAARRQSRAPAVMAASRQLRGARRAAGAPTATCRRCARSMRACCSRRPSLGCWARRRSRSGRGRATWRPAAAAAPAPPAPARRPRGATPPASSAPARRCRARSASQWRSRRRSQWRAGFPGARRRVYAHACVVRRSRVGLEKPKGPTMTARAFACGPPQCPDACPACAGHPDVQSERASGAAREGKRAAGAGQGLRGLERAGQATRAGF